MPATNYTPIQLYRTNTASTTAPSGANLNAGELAINYNDSGMILYAKNTSGTVIKLMNNPASLLYPTADGSAGQAIVTNGSGTLSFATAGLAWQSVQTTGFTAVAGRAYPCNTTSAAFTVTLPATPSAGDLVTLVDYAATWDTNNLTVNPNGNKLNGAVSNGTLYAERGSVNLVYVDSTQGWISYASNGTTNIAQAPPTVEYLVVAGGGGGGFRFGGGGGAGGFRTATGLAVTAGTSITVTVGSGGAGAANNNVPGSKGGDSVFSTITSTGGGGGRSSSDSKTSTNDGGSGGGGNSSASSAGSGNTPNTAPSQGNNGGDGNRLNGSCYGGGGGGGANGAGTNGPSSTGGNGGGGTASSISGPSVTYAGGGGGAAENTAGSGGTGGSGGGGNGGNGGSPSSSTAGGTNLGGGGGADSTPSGTARAGGSGIVIIRYADTFAAAVSTTGSPTITVAGGYRVYSWTGNGSITF